MSAGTTKTVALVTHRSRDDVSEVARRAAEWLIERGHSVRVPEGDAEGLGLTALAVDAEKLAPGCDLAVSVGGDGTILRTVELVAADGVPVLGVNMGRLGYLTEVEPADLEAALDRVLSGSCNIEERMTLSVTVESTDGAIPAGPYLGLNEAVVEKPGAGHTVQVGVEIGGRFFTSFAADGLIVATPTGSTAYAFSARGPIVAPGLRALVMTPVSPHMLFDRSLVIEPGDSIRLVVTHDRPATLTIDGNELGVLSGGDAITCRAGPHPARFVTFGRHDFYGILKAKFGLADR